MSGFNINTRKEVFTLAWDFVKRLGFTLSEALKVAWRNVKFKAAAARGIVQFFFLKVDGTTRQAFGTLKESLLPPTGEGRKRNDSLQTYFDTEKGEWRCFKKCNLLSIV